jgi:hypothetical protein
MLETKNVISIGAQKAHHLMNQLKQNHYFVNNMHHPQWWML